MDQVPQPSPNLPTPEEQRILTFEEFTSPVPRGYSPKHRNFFQYFRVGLTGNGKRTSEYYLRFVKENLELARSLYTGITIIQCTSDEIVDRLKPFEQDLYKAYTIMRSYGASDDELFA